METRAEHLESLDPKLARLRGLTRKSIKALGLVVLATTIATGAAGTATETIAEATDSSALRGVAALFAPEVAEAASEIILPPRPEDYSSFEIGIKVKLLMEDSFGSRTGVFGVVERNPNNGQVQIRVSEVIIRAGPQPSARVGNQKVYTGDLFWASANTLFIEERVATANGNYREVSVNRGGRTTEQLRSQFETLIRNGGDRQAHELIWQNLSTKEREALYYVIGGHCSEETVLEALRHPDTTDRMETYLDNGALDAKRWSLSELLAENCIEGN